MRAHDTAKAFNSVFHFHEATIDLLHDLYAKPLSAGVTPKASLYWAAECALYRFKFSELDLEPNSTDGMRLLTERRTDSTAGAWAELFPGCEIVCSRGGLQAAIEVIFRYLYNMKISQALDKCLVDTAVTPGVISRDFELSLCSRIVISAT